jgi:hypothetical protein
MHQTVRKEHELPRALHVVLLDEDWLVPGRNLGTLGNRECG